jgi:uncharacterized membrane protein YkoI
MTPARFDELLKAWHEGRATREELAEFEALLRGDARFRRELVQSVLLDVHLYRRYAGAAKARPRRRRRIWEAAAALLIVSLSAVAVVQLLLKTANTYAVLEGELASGAREVKEGDLVEARSPATIRLGTHASHVRLSAGSAGRVRKGGFEILRGGGTFAFRDTLRLFTPAGTVEALGEFTAELLPLDGESRPELAVAVTAGSAEVEAWETRDALRAGEGRTFGPPVSAGMPNYYVLLKGNVLTLGDAIDRALAIVPGVPIQAALEEEEGRTVYAVDVATGRTVRELSFDARTGELVEDDTDEDDESKLAAAVKVPLKAAILRALAEHPGRAVEAEIELKGGKARSEVKVFRAGKLREIKSDAD